MGDATPSMERSKLTRRDVFSTPQHLRRRCRSRNNSWYPMNSWKTATVLPQIQTVAASRTNWRPTDVFLNRPTRRQTQVSADLLLSAVCRRPDLVSRWTSPSPSKSATTMMTHSSWTQITTLVLVHHIAPVSLTFRRSLFRPIFLRRMTSQPTGSASSP